MAVPLGLRALGTALGLALGAALLMLEGKVDGLKDILNQVNKWIMSLITMASS